MSSSQQQQQQQLKNSATHNREYLGSQHNFQHGKYKMVLRNRILSYNTNNNSRSINPQLSLHCKSNARKSSSKSNVANSMRNSDNSKSDEISSTRNSNNTINQKNSRIRNSMSRNIRILVSIMVMMT